MDDDSPKSCSKMYLTFMQSIYYTVIVTAGHLFSTRATLFVSLILATDCTRARDRFWWWFLSQHLIPSAYRQDAIGEKPRKKRNLTPHFAIPRENVANSRTKAVICYMLWKFISREQLRFPLACRVLKTTTREWKYLK